MSEIIDSELGNTQDAGEKAIDRVHGLLEQLSHSVNNLTENVGTLATHVAKLEVQKVVDDVPHGVREGVNDGMDTVGAAGGVVSKGVDVPLAVSEDVIHDTGEGIKETGEGVKQVEVKTRRKLFRKRR
jgi:hypothetical protein